MTSLHNNNSTAADATQQLAPPKWKEERIQKRCKVESEDVQNQQEWGVEKINFV
jgi:hypothetical protein